MGGLLDFLAAPFFTSPVTTDPYAPHWIVGIVYKLHTLAGSFLFLASSLTFFKEVVGDHIRCISDESDAVGSVVIN